jgi:hypothetical protein
MPNLNLKEEYDATVLGIVKSDGEASRDNEVWMLKNEIKKIGEALNDPRVDLTMTMSEAILELRQQLAASVSDRDYLAAALQFAVNMLTEGSEFFACLPDEITFAAAKELNEFFRLVDITNTESKP